MNDYDSRYEKEITTVLEQLLKPGPGESGGCAFAFGSDGKLI